MKKLVFFVFIACKLSVQAQDFFNDVIPVIHANSPIADYRIRNEWIRNSWKIDAEQSPAILKVYFSGNEVSFGFYTDTDSIAFALKPGESREFYVLYKGKFALTEVQAIQFTALGYDTVQKKPRYKIIYETELNNDYLQRLKEEYGLEQISQGCVTEEEKVLKVVKWVRDKWQHTDDKELTKDIKSIFQEGKDRRDFDGKAYVIIAKACLDALGMPARVVRLRPKDVEMTDPGHVLLEVYFKEHKKWALLDVEYNSLPILDSKPLNVVEFRNAIARNYGSLQIQAVAGTTKVGYVNFIFPYLYSLQINLDNRVLKSGDIPPLYAKKRLILLPKEASNAVIFTRRSSSFSYAFTYSLADFYAAPSFKPVLPTAK